MRFGNPILLTALLLIPLFIVAFRLCEHRKGTIRFSDISPFKGLPVPKSLRLRYIIPVLRILAIFCIVVAFARPHSTHKTGEIITEGIDIMLTLDTSTSMNIDDFKPQNRFEAAKVALSDFISNSSNNRLGLVIYAAQAYAQCPLTLDYGVLMNLLNSVEMGMIEDGTAIGMAIASAVNRLKDSSAKSKVIILLTDGLNNAGDISPITAAKLAKTLGIKIYTIGMGREGGTPIYQDHPIFGRIYQKDKYGNLIMNEIDEDTLVEISRITDGRYFRATDEQKLKSIYEDISKMEKSKIKTEHKILYSEYFQYFLIPAIAFLILESILGLTRFRILP